VSVLVTAWRFGVFWRPLPPEVGFHYGFTARSAATGGLLRVLTSQLLTRDIFMALSMALSLLVMLGLYEAIAGPRRAAVVATVSFLAAPLAVAAGLGAWSWSGSSFAVRTLSTLDYGASPITAAGGGALVAIIGHRRLRWGAVGFVLAGLAVHHQLADWEHLIAFPIGYGLGRSLGVATPAVGANEARRHRFRRFAATGALVASGVAASPLLIRSASATARGPAPITSAGAVPTGGPMSPPRLVYTTFPAPSLHTRLRVLVVLPAGYDHTRQNYPVVEVLHGRPGRPEDLFVGGDLLGAIAAPRMPAFVAVVPDGRGPVVGDGDFADTSRQHLGAAMSDDLRAWATATYRTTGWFGAAGISAGGYGAAYLGARAPGAYQAICAIGGYFEARLPAFAGQTATVRDLASPVLHPARLGPATMLIVPAGDLDAVTEATRYEGALKKAGQRLIVRLVPGRHDWAVFRADLPACLQFAATGSVNT
jgi:enterochelin esterase-like enzyme